VAELPGTHDLSADPWIVLLDKASSTPPVPPDWPTISLHQRVVNIHSCSRSPA
jgi:hypothetical protein